MMDGKTSSPRDSNRLLNVCEGIAFALLRTICKLNDTQISSLLFVSFDNIDRLEYQLFDSIMVECRRSRLKSHKMLFGDIEALVDLYNRSFPIDCLMSMLQKSTYDSAVDAGAMVYVQCREHNLRMPHSPQFYDSLQEVLLLKVERITPEIQSLGIVKSEPDRSPACSGKQGFKPRFRWDILDGIAFVLLHDILLWSRHDISNLLYLDEERLNSLDQLSFPERDIQHREKVIKTRVMDIGDVRLLVQTYLQRVTNGRELIKRAVEKDSNGYRKASAMVCYEINHRQCMLVQLPNSPDNRHSRKTKKEIRAKKLLSFGQSIEASPEERRDAANWDVYDAIAYLIMTRCQKLAPSDVAENLNTNLSSMQESELLFHAYNVKERSHALEAETRSIRQVKKMLNNYCDHQENQCKFRYFTNLDTVKRHAIDVYSQMNGQSRKIKSIQEDRAVQTNKQRRGRTIPLNLCSDSSSTSWSATKNDTIKLPPRGVVSDPRASEALAIDLLINQAQDRKAEETSRESGKPFNSILAIPNTAKKTIQEASTFKALANASNSRAVDTRKPNVLSLDADRQRSDLADRLTIDLVSPTYCNNSLSAQKRKRLKTREEDGKIVKTCKLGKHKHVEVCTVVQSSSLRSLFGSDSESDLNAEPDSAISSRSISDVQTSPDNELAEEQTESTSNSLVTLQPWQVTVGPKEPIPGQCRYCHVRQSEMSTCFVRHERLCTRNEYSEHNRKAYRLKRIREIGRKQGLPVITQKTIEVPKSRDNKCQYCLRELRSAQLKRHEMYACPLNPDQEKNIVERDLNVVPLSSGSEDDNGNFIATTSIWEGFANATTDLSRSTSAQVPEATGPEVSGPTRPCRYCGASILSVKWTYHERFLCIANTCVAMNRRKAGLPPNDESTTIQSIKAIQTATSLKPEHWSMLYKLTSQTSTDQSKKVLLVEKYLLSKTKLQISPTKPKLAFVEFLLNSLVPNLRHKDGDLATSYEEERKSVVRCYIDGIRGTQEDVDYLFKLTPSIAEQFLLVM